jgi:hypothetical protein
MTINMKKEYRKELRGLKSQLKKLSKDYDRVDRLAAREKVAINRQADRLAKRMRILEGRLG